MNKFTQDNNIHAIIRAKNRLKHGVVIVNIAFGVFFSSALFASDNSEQFLLKNLERERAALLTVLLDKKLSFTQRQLKASTLLQRLATVERLALNNEATENSQLAQQVFSQYELSFLLHASAEQNHIVTEHWLNQLSISANDIEQGWAGER